MRKTILGGLAIVTLGAALASPPMAAVAQDWHQNGDRGRHGGHGDNHWQGNRDGGWDPADHYRQGGSYRVRRLGRGDDVYRGRDGRYYCRRNDGTTGLVIGALGGGVLGNLLGDGGSLGTLLGAGGGALLGRSIDRGNIRCR
ncbi:MAG TPA: glycine zipper 2TM domain-containing protein [Sphingomonas sp.]